MFVKNKRTRENSFHKQGMQAHHKMEKRNQQLD